MTKTQFTFALANALFVQRHHVRISQSDFHSLKISAASNAVIVADEVYEQLDDNEAIELYLRIFQKRVGSTLVTTVGLQQFAKECVGNANEATKFFKEQLDIVLSSFTRDEIDATDAAYKLMLDNDVSPDEVIGTGEDGRILKGDVVDYLASQL